MKNPKATWLFLFIFLIQSRLPAQDKVTIKFGKIAVEDFNLSKYKPDTSEAAIVMADIGESHYEADGFLGYRLVYTHYKRAKILNKNGYKIATVTIPLYSRGPNGEKLLALKANTYNLENGQVVDIKADDKSVLTENFTGDIYLKKFTFPGIKEGSIIEFSYTVESAIQLSLQPWSFQGEYRCLWSEYSASIPEAFDYVILQQGFNPYYINEENYDMEFRLKIIKHHWAMKDVPALTEEKYTSTINNYVSKIEFQLSSIHFPGKNLQNIISDWTKISEQLMASENFGTDVTKNNGWLDDDLKTITGHAPGKLEKAKKIYAFVRDHFTCTQYERTQISAPLKTIFKNRSGNEAEINLLLAAMLNRENIHSDPVILCTSSHGFVNEFYPLLYRYNYVLCDAIIDSSVYFLDASRECLDFNHLPEYCYNGQARIINKESPRPVYFRADSLQETKLTSVFITNDDKQPHDISGTFQSNLGDYGSYKLREKLTKKTENEFFKDIRLSNNNEMKIENTGIDSLTQPEYPATVHYEFAIKNGASADIIYFNPLMSEALKENPLKATTRKYPVEMPYRMDEVYTFDMEIPVGYVVEEMPKSEKIVLNGVDGFFEYLIDKNETDIQLRTHIKLNKANFPVEDYGILRDFFSYVVKKQSEQVVFKKKK